MRLFRRSSDERAAGDDAWAVVGLGNPGERYAGTRHNAGAMALHLLVERSSARLKSHKSGCLVVDVRVGDTKVVLARPMAYMNESGRPVKEMLRWHRIPIERLVVVHDELDVPFGEVRIKVGGGTAGHNGLGSLVNHLHTKDFVRVRVGVGRPRGEADAAAYVLSDFGARERKELPDLLARSADAVERIVEVGAERAMNEVNTRTR